ncbi:MAG: hypothetical protein HUJ90_06660, partial [Bacteroidales bacterium]|nr:hypothetical protein [Bacteroidales bacterium]
MQVNKVERALHKRQNLMEKYLHQVEQIPVNEWIDLEDFPEDMVLYRYNADTLQSWVNQFTISNDEVDVAPLWYRLHYMSNGNYHNAPLAYLSEKESYVNLGSGWYVLDVHTHGAVKIITGILIKSEYPTDRKVPAEIMNKRLKFGGSYVSSEIDANRGGIVYGIHGTPLFSVYRQTPSAGHGDGMMMRMMAILLALVALLIYHSTRRTARSMWVTLLLLTLLYLLSNYVGRSMEELSQFFSPLLYADDKLFGSLAELVFCNLYIYLFVRVVYMNRLVWYKMVRSASKRFRDTVSALCFIAIMVLVGYIYISLHSLITNSVIILELFRVTDITLYTAVSYISFSLLFLVLVYLLQMANTLSKGNRTVSFFSWKYLAAFVLAISTFTLITVSVVSDKKEIDNNRVLVNKLSVERDLNLEMELRKVENAIANDRIIATLSYWAEGGADVIRNRIQERYLSSAQNYDIGVTSCRSNTSLIIDAYTPAVECYDFFRNEIDTYGTPLAPGSSFFFMNNYQGKSSYIGVFSYFNYQNYQSARLFVELVPKYSISPIEELVLHQNVRNNSTVPSSYSYAKYVGGNLSTHTGEFNYPLRFSLESSGQAYKVERSNGMVHYIGVVADDVIIVLSRAQRGFFAYLISFSYLLFLYGTIAIILTRRYRKRSALSIPQHSFKRKITMLLVVSIVAALLCVGAGSVIYTVRRSGDNIQNQMFNRLDIVQSTLSEFCKYALRYNDINTPQLFDAMQRVANNTQSDINLYDVYGRLIRSTKPEFFEQYIMGSRINHNAFYHITIKKDSRYLGLEKVA